MTFNLRTHLPDDIQQTLNLKTYLAIYEEIT